MKKIDIVSSPIYTNSTGELSQERDLYLTENGDILLNNGEIVNHSDCYSRPLTISEVFGKFEQRRWNIPIKKMILINNMGEGDLYLIKDNLQNTNSPSTSMNFKANMYNGLNRSSGSLIPNNCVSMMGYEGSIDSNDITIESINEKYRNIMDKITSIDLYNSSKMEIDLTEDLSISLDLVSPGQYSNTISLLEVEKKAVKPGLTALVNLSIRYSINGTIYSKNLSFEGFRYNLNSVSEKTDFINTVGEYPFQISVEYINGTIRVIPDSDYVDECIISSCVVTYGNI